MAIDRATDTRIKNIEIFVKGNITDIQASATQKTNIQLTPNGLGFYTILENSLGGVELALNGKSFLLVGQTNPAENGLYVITALNPNTITRSTDFTTYQQIYNTRIQIVEGDYAGNWYQSSTTEPFTIDTTPITIVDTDEALENLQSAVANLNNSLNNVENLVGIEKKETIFISKSFDTNQNLQYDPETQLYTLNTNETLNVGEKILLLQETIFEFNGIFSIISEEPALTYQLTNEVNSTNLENTIVHLNSTLHKVIGDKNENQSINFFLSQILDYADILKALLNCLTQAQAELLFLPLTGGTITGATTIEKNEEFYYPNLKLSSNGGSGELLQIVRSSTSEDVNSTDYTGIRMNFNSTNPSTGTAYFLDMNSSLPTNISDFVLLYGSQNIQTVNGYICTFEIYYNIQTITSGVWDYYIRYSIAEHTGTFNGIDIQANIGKMNDGSSVSGINFTLNTSDKGAGDVEIFETNSNINYTAEANFRGIKITPTITGLANQVLGALIDVSNCVGQNVKAIKTIGDVEINGNILGEVLTTRNQTSTPSNPQTGEVKFYTKEDNKLYKLDSLGNEVEIGSGGGGGTGGEVVPIGTIQGYYGNTIPAGYLLCDGSIFNAVDYPELNTFLGTNTLPDLRGYFLRGLGGVDPDGGTRTLGSIQEDDLKSHNHVYLKTQDQVEAGILGYAQENNDGNLVSTDTSSTGGLETRPKNIAVNYIIKAKHNPVSAYNLVAGTDISITTNELDKTATISSTGYTNAQIDTALDLKENTITAGTTAQYFRGDKTWQTLDKSAVGLSNVDNTSDLDKPISTATQTALDLKANSSDVYTKTETYTKAEVDSKIPLVGINFATFSTSFGSNITLNAGSNTPVNITDDIFATASLSPSFANVFTYSGGVLFVKNTIRNIEINFDVIVSLLYNGGQNSQFEVRIVNASTGTKVIARQFNQTSSLQSTQVQRVAQILPLTLPATALGNNYMQTVGFRIEVISGSTAVAVTIIGIEPSVRQVSSYQ